MSIVQIILNSSHLGVLGTQTLLPTEKTTNADTYQIPISTTVITPIPNCGLINYLPVVKAGTTCPINMAQSINYTCTNGITNTYTTDACSSYYSLKSIVRSICEKYCLLTPTPAYSTPTPFPTTAYIRCQDLVDMYNTSCSFGGSTVVPSGTVSCPIFKDFVYITSCCPMPATTIKPIPTDPIYTTPTFMPRPTNTYYPTPTLAYASPTPAPRPTTISFCSLKGITGVSWCNVEKTTAKKATFTCNNGFSSTFTSPSCLTYVDLKSKLSFFCQNNCNFTHQTPATLQKPLSPQ